MILNNAINAYTRRIMNNPITFTWDYNLRNISFGLSPSTFRTILQTIVAIETAIAIEKE